jgi:hypothetical protein
MSKKEKKDVMTQVGKGCSLSSLFNFVHAKLTKLVTSILILLNQGILKG